MSILNYSKENKKFCLELGRVKLLLQKAGNPDKKYKIIHVTGTNGKGSVCAFLESGIVNMGIRLGRFSSPELFCVEDSISVNSIPIGKRALRNIVKLLEPLADEVAAELGKAPSSFEMLFVAAMVYFAKKRCKMVILECGMGGEGDATNAIEKSDIAVFTNIDFDHSEYLGNTLPEIAGNKCGIIRDETNVFSALQPEDVENVIVKECKRKKCNLGFVAPLKTVYMDKLNVVTNVGCGNTRLSLAGVHQAANAALAIRILQSLDADETHILHSLTQTVNRARLEEIAPGIYFDGAHNPAGVRSLVQSINAAKIDGRMIFAIGFMADKDIAGCLDELKNLDNKDFEIYTATVKSNPRSETSLNLAEFARQKGYSATSFDNISDAVKSATDNADTVFAFGSLYMYKELFKEGNLK